MPSRAEAQYNEGVKASALSRVRLELALRVFAFCALIGALLVVSEVFRASGASTGVPVLFRADIAAAPGFAQGTGQGTAQGTASLASLVKASLLDIDASHTGLRPVHVLASRVPSDTNRALLSAARSAGIPVSWTDSIKGGAVAVEVRALIDPKGGYALRVAAPDNTPVAIRDSLGLIDSVKAAGGGASLIAGRLAGSVVAVTNAARAVATIPSPPIVRRVLVYADPGWEGKFTVAALEERGWTVEVRYAIGKNVTVTQGAPVAPDTARYAAVVALDSSVLPQVAAIRRYVQSGGGVVIAGAATTLREFGALLPGRPNARQPGVPGGLNTDTPLVGLGWRPLVPDSNAFVIARSSRVASGASVASVIARRFGAGRVVESAYDGVWEWRMAGPEGSVDAHRAWWSELVRAVAFAPEQSNGADGAPAGRLRDVPGRAAPYADTKMRLGHPNAMPTFSAGVNGSTNWELYLLLVAIACLLGEWTSRRLRGSK